MSERAKTPSKATKESTPRERLAGVKRSQARVSPRGGGVRSERAAAHQ